MDFYSDPQPPTGNDEETGRDDARPVPPAADLPASPPAPPSPKMHGCLKCCLVSFIAVVVVVGILAFATIWQIGSLIRDGADHFQAMSEGDCGVDDDPGLTEVWSTGVPREEAKAVCLRVPLTGTIAFESASRYFADSDTASALTALQAIEFATDDPDIKALLLEIDSGGGSLTDSDVLYKAILEFKQAQPDRKIVVLMGDMACSGAYYISVPADRIIAHPTTITGSIGVIIPGVNAHELAEMLGIRNASISSGANKDMLNPLNAPSPEQDRLVQEIVDEYHSRFCDIVALHRKLSKARVSELADGRIYSASKAVAAGLVDEIGYLEEARLTVQALVGTKDVCYIRYEPKRDFFSFLHDPVFWGTAFRSAVTPLAAPSAPQRAKAQR